MFFFSGKLARKFEFIYKFGQAGSSKHIRRMPISLAMLPIVNLKIFLCSISSVCFAAGSFTASSFIFSYFYHHLLFRFLYQHNWALEIGHVACMSDKFILNLREFFFYSQIFHISLGRFFYNYILLF